MPIKKGDTKKRGNLRFLIEIQKPAPVQGKSGATSKKDWAIVCKAFAEYEDVSGREYKADQNGFIAGQLTVRFLINYREGIDQSMRVVFRGVKYQVSETRRIQQGNNQRLEIYADRITLDGH